MKGFDGPIYYSTHHLSHASASFYTSPFKEAAVITFDGVGEWETTTWGTATEEGIELKEAIHFPHSLGMLYSAFTYYLGFKVNSGEYKVMGLAPYGKPKYVDLIKENIIKIHKDGSYTLNMKYFSFLESNVMISKEFVELFGHPPRKPESRITEFHADVAASIQEVLEEVILNIVNKVYDKTEEDNLVLGGGVALNSVANYKILKESSFESIFVHPAAGDAGSSLGAALLFYWKGRKFKGIREFSPYLGAGFSAEEIRRVLEKIGAKVKHMKREDLIKEAVAMLKEKKIIGWFQGRAEWGPRALGNRSILADPRWPEMKEIVNKKIKFREPFRPFAPSVLEEIAKEYFDISVRDKPAYYMLVVAKVKKPKEIPAVTHVDGTGRLQIVSKKMNPAYHALITQFYEETGVPVVLNTSFNLRGEPIVNSPADAFRTFATSKMDALFFPDAHIYLLKEKQDEEVLERWKIGKRELD